MENTKEMRIIGKSTEQRKEVMGQLMELALQDPYELFSPKKREKIKRMEYPKSEEETEVLLFVDDKMKKLSSECGAEPYDIPVANTHIVPDELFYEINGSGNKLADAGGIIGNQSIFMKASAARKSTFVLGTLSAHEGFHLRGHLTRELNETESEDDFELTNFREGISVNSTQKKNKNGEVHRHFEGAHEALASLMEKNMVPVLMEHPLFAEYKKWRESEEGKKTWSELAKKLKVSEEEITWVNPEKTDEYEKLASLKQRKTLEYVFEEIQKQFPEQYETAEDVYKEFLKTQFTGRLLPVARLVEKTFGEGSFRMLGSMDTDKNSAIVTLEALKKARMRTLRDAGK